METMKFDIKGDALNIYLVGDFVKQDLPQALFEQINAQKITKILIDSSLLEKWDSSFLVMLYELYQKASQKNIVIKASKLPNGVEALIKLALSVPRASELAPAPRIGFLEKAGDLTIRVYQTIRKTTKFTLHNLRIFFSSFLRRTTTRDVDFLFALQDCGPKALPIVLLISFMVGLILAFVGAVQLQMFGAEVYVASLVTIGMTRIMGAIMVGIIMAGRTGASFAATIGTMQVNEEIDALKTMGINVSEFLVLPRLKALVVTMPLLTMLADFAGILGGAAVGILALNIPYSEFFKYAYNAWFLKHFLVGLFHAFVFGFIIALSGCYFGINCGRDADSVGKSTTSAVVYSIVWMIIATGLITFCFQRMGI